MLDDLDRQKLRLFADTLVSCLSRVLQPIENLVGVHAISPSNLTDRDTGKARLRADLPLLLLAPIPATPTLRQNQPRKCPLSSVDTISHYPLLAEQSDRTLTIQRTLLPFEVGGLNLLPLVKIRKLFGLLLGERVPFRAVDLDALTVAVFM